MSQYNPARIIFTLFLLLNLLSLTACVVSEDDDNNNPTPENNGLINYAENLGGTWNVTEEVLSSTAPSSVGNETTYELTVVQNATNANLLDFNDGTHEYDGQLSGKKVQFVYNYLLPEVTGYRAYINETDLTVSADGSKITGTYQRQIQDTSSLSIFNTSQIEFTATREIEDQYENNDTLETATTTVAQTSYDGNQFDDDWFAIEPPADKLRLQIALIFTSADGDIDMELYNALGEVIFQSTSRSDGESMDLAVSLSQTYYIRIFGDTDGNKGNKYTLTWNNIAN